MSRPLDDGCAGKSLPGSQDRQDPAERPARGQLIVCQGVPRSASTWVLNMVAAIISEARPQARVLTCYADIPEDIGWDENARGGDVMVVKSHAAEPSLLGFVKAREIPVIVSVRNPCDCVASYLQVFGGDFAAREREVSASFAAAVALAREAGAYVVNYDAGFENTATVLGIARHLGLPMTQPQAERLLTTLTPAAVEAEIARLIRSGKLDPSNVCSVDPGTHWTPRHLGDRRIGKYREILTGDQIASIAGWSAPYCRAFGFESCHRPAAALDERAREIMARLKGRGIGRAGIPENCGIEAALGVQESPEWRVWVDKETTPDQLRIENYLAHCAVAGRSILHIGAGNSGLALRFYREACKIVGTTIYDEEREFAERLALPNYEALALNKYSRQMAEIDDEFDFIIDNNPASFSCCLFHFCRMMTAYCDLLSEQGELVTAQPGFGWVISGRDRDWSLGWDDWAALAEALGLHATKIDDFVYTMGRSSAAPSSSDSAGASTGRQPEPALDRPQAIAQRLGAVIGQLRSVKESFSELLAREIGRPPASDTLQQNLAALFTRPVAAAVSRALGPYEDIAPGVRAGFETGTNLRLTIAPKRDRDASPEDWLNSLHLRFGGGGWFSIEAAAAGAEVAAAESYQFALCARASRPVECRLMLRRQQGAFNEDIVLREFRLHPAEHTYNAAGDIDPVAAHPAATAMETKVLLLFSSTAELDLELDYINFYFR